jgi:hypothetical protein
MTTTRNGQVTAIRGTVIVTTEYARQRSLFVDGLGHLPVAEESLTEAQVRTVFGLDGRRACATLFEVPGSRIGAWVVEFDPQDETVIRVGGVGYACDALKMIDFFTADRPAAIARLKGLGFEFVSEGAELTLPDGNRFAEAHMRGPDGVMVAIIESFDQPLSRFVSVTDRLSQRDAEHLGPGQRLRAGACISTRTCSACRWGCATSSRATRSRRWSARQADHADPRQQLRPRGRGRDARHHPLRPAARIVRVAARAGPAAAPRPRRRAPRRHRDSTRCSRAAPRPGSRRRCRLRRAVAQHSRAGAARWWSAPHGVWHWLVEAAR